MSRFRTVEISDPRFESNNLRFITIKSPALKRRGDISVFVPPGLESIDNLPLVLLLHGVYGSHWIWSHKAGIHITALDLIESEQIRPMVIAMPSDGLWGDGSGYLPHKEINHEEWIMVDVIESVKELIPQVSKSSTLFISGLSMGGYGALRLGTKYSNRFRAISAHSSITAFEQFSYFVEEYPNGYELDETEEKSLFDLMVQNRDMLPPIRFDCGLEDLLIEHNRRLHKELKEKGIEHIYEEFPGKHEWRYWEEHIKDTLIFFNKYL
jgi:putative tributyrin esterase